MRGQIDVPTNRIKNNMIKIPLPATAWVLQATTSNWRFTRKFAPCKKSLLRRLIIQATTRITLTTRPTDLTTPTRPPPEMPVITISIRTSTRDPRTTTCNSSSSNNNHNSSIHIILPIPITSTTSTIGLIRIITINTRRRILLDALGNGRRPRRLRSTTLAAITAMCK